MNRKKNKKNYESQFPTNKIIKNKIKKKIIKNKKQDLCLSETQVYSSQHINEFLKIHHLKEWDMIIFYHPTGATTSIT